MRKTTIFLNTEDLWLWRDYTLNYLMKNAVTEPRKPGL
jgi:hypothetical protein